ncbi:MAG: hypothetical protein OQK12_12620 [Motiliproteus sp.]|nr:hypothetical protein [Motiliproteus sp.]MCW9052759.1 hypothetical protein [Motiliproteus sp.]
MAWLKVGLLALLMALGVQVYGDNSANGRSILVDLKLDSSLQQYAEKPWIVYVFARPEDKRVPLASKKLTLDRVPLLVELTEKNYLLENLTLANADQVVVYVKVTRHGSPHKTAVGDLLGESKTVDFGQSPQQRIELVIDQEVK